MSDTVVFWRSELRKRLVELSNEGGKMVKKRRLRLKDGDVVEVVNVPDDAAYWHGRRGVIKGVWGEDRTWSVMFLRVVGNGHDTVSFRRHELRKVG